MTWTQSGYNFIIIIVQQRQVHMHYCECRQPGLLPRMRQWERISWDCLKKKACTRHHSVMSEPVRPQCMVRGGLMPGLMEYVSPISPASRVWLGLPAGEAALIFAPQPADSQHREQLIRHTQTGPAHWRGPHSVWARVKDSGRNVKRKKWFPSDKGGKLSLPTVVIFSMHQNVRYNHSKTHNNDFLSYTCHE